jgi:hypothetical protein
VDLLAIGPFAVRRSAFFAGGTPDAGPAAGGAGAGGAAAGAGPSSPPRGGGHPLMPGPGPADRTASAVAGHEGGGVTAG